RWKIQSSVRSKIQSINTSEQPHSFVSEPTFTSPTLNLIAAPAHSTHNTPSMLSCRMPIGHHGTTSSLHTPVSSTCTLISSHSSAAAVTSWRSYSSSSSISSSLSRSSSSSGTGYSMCWLTGLGCETPRGNPWVEGAVARRGVVAHARRKR
ncbi:unnamed protein product, partial [Closterium sp. NIES-54]